MKSYEITAILSTVIVILGTLWYHKLLFQNEVKTISASWIVNMVAMIITTITYWTTPGANWMGYSLPFASLFTVGSILVVVLIYEHKNGQRKPLNSFQRKCLIVSGVIVLLWIVIKWVFHGTGKLPFFLNQGIMVIAYWMLIVKCWKSDENTESFVLWWAVCIASVLAFVTAYLKGNDPLAWWYATRSTVMSAMLLFTLYRTEWRKEERAELLYGAHRRNSL